MEDGDEGGYCTCGGKIKAKEYWSGYRDPSGADHEDGGAEGVVDLAKALKGDGKGGFNEVEVRRGVRALGRTERMRL